MLTLDAIVSRFPEGVPPDADSDDVVRAASTADGASLVANLVGKTWKEVASPRAFWSIERDPIVWLCLMPVSWFSHYLPAMLAVSLSDNSPAATNLRANLLTFLAPGRHATDLNWRVKREIDKRLQPPQLALIDEFVRKFEGPVEKNDDVR